MPHSYSYPVTTLDNDKKLVFQRRAKMSGVSKIVAEKNHRILLELVAQPGNGQYAAYKEREMHLWGLIAGQINRCLCRLQRKGTQMGVS